MALKGIKVLEIAGLAPAPFCGMLLSDFGANVIRVDRTKGMDVDRLARGKRSISVNLKDVKGQEIVRKLASTSDVLIEPFRPGVMEKLNLGPDKLLSSNPKLVYARLSGYGQTGAYALKSGHDINYVAMSGLLSKIGRKNEKPHSPLNLVADFAGGGLLCAYGIVMCLLERQQSGKGQVVDMSMTEGAGYVGSFIFNGKDLPFWGKPRGENWLDGGAHFYDTYETKDGKYMAVGSIEPQFYQQLMQGLEMTSEDTYIEQFSDFEEGKKKIAKKFSERTQAEWSSIFDKLDACVTPVLDIDEAPEQEPNVSRKSFTKSSTTGNWEPEPAPKLSRTPGQTALVKRCPGIGEHTVEILNEIGYNSGSIKELIASEIVTAPEAKSKL
ncbi:unnamed protein product [Orchesella dallaii]|uniref:Alpha-methylacyl-CoA racemase n=1 Tax=Orchesella dallaii TaxID=48710 RepID=A0ABP1R868_9HEXA